MSNRSGGHYRIPAQMEPLLVVADYRPAPLGGWSARVQLPDRPDIAPRQVHDADLRSAFDVVMAEIEDLADVLDRSLGTIHTLEGDPAAFAELAARMGLNACSGRSTSRVFGS